MALIEFWTCCALLLYGYALYPLLVGVLAKRIGTPVVGDDTLRTVAIIVTAYNDADCIRSKLETLAGLDYPSDLIRILVVADGSSDETETIAAAYEARPIRVLRV